VGAITLNPTPEFGDACFDCLNCVRVCPNDAITPTPSIAALEKMIRNRVKTINEQPRSQLFVADKIGTTAWS
jgi:ferredoxin